MSATSVTATAGTSIAADVQLRVRVPARLDAELRLWAVREDVSVNQFVIDALYAHVADLTSGVRGREDAFVLTLDRLVTAVENLAGLMVVEEAEALASAD